MLKLWIALCLALVVGILTLVNGVYYSARIGTILYRVVISVFVFGFAGYGIGFAVEDFLKKESEENTAQQQEFDIESEQQPINEQVDESEFSPFTSDNFEQISRPKE